MMLRNLTIVVLGLLMFALMACELKTPEIRGVVLDEETKQPVEAWVHATLQIKTKTIQGDVQTVLRVEPPHTRSNKKGEFLIPAKEIKKPSFPAGLGTEIENFSVNASTIDDKSGGFYLKDYKGKEKIEVTIYVKPWEKGLTNEREYFSYIQSLYKYCLSGRSGVEVPAVEGGCDKWELNYVIVKHERYLERFKNIIEEKGYSNALDQVADLFDRKGDYSKAVEALKKNISLMENRNLLRFKDWQKEKEGIEWKINKLQKKLLHKKDK